MTALYLKLLITPALMLAISLAARRWGTHIGGLLSGLPITSGLVMLFLSLEQGAGFALHAVPGALAGLAAIQATYLFYFQITRRLSAFPACLGALGFYAVAGWVLTQLGMQLLSIIATLLLVAMLICVTGEKEQRHEARYVPLPRWVIPMRMLTATALLLAITASAQWLGPVVSGLLAPVPVIAWPLAVFAHVQGGRHELGAVVRGNGIGAVGVVGFYLLLQATIVHWGVVPSLASAVLLAMVLTAGLARMLSRR